MIYIQPDAEDAFSEVRKYMKKLDFRLPQGKGLKETVGHNLDYMVCSDRDSDPGRRLERPICLAGLHHRSRAHPKAYKLIFNFLKSRRAASQNFHPKSYISKGHSNRRNSSQCFPSHLSGL